jgi:hypothetical protein
MHNIKKRRENEEELPRTGGGFNVIDMSIVIDRSSTHRLAMDDRRDLRPYVLFGAVSSLILLRSDGRSLRPHKQMLQVLSIKVPDIQS